MQTVDKAAPEVREIEGLAADAGFPMTRVLNKAGVALTTWWRWRQGSDPKAGTLRKLKDTISEMQADA